VGKEVDGKGRGEGGCGGREGKDGGEGGCGEREDREVGGEGEGVDGGGSGDEVDNSSRDGIGWVGGWVGLVSEFDKSANWPYCIQFILKRVQA
jgi:hypothetical protein